MISGAYALAVPGFLSSTTGAWSLGIEGAFYIVFPLVGLAAMNARPRALAVVAAFLILCQQGMIYLLRGMDDAAFWNFYITPLVLAPCFPLGVLIFRSDAGRQSFHPVWNVVCLVCIAGFSIVVPGDVMRAHGSYLLLTAMSALCVWLAYRARIGERLAPLCSFLGDISYSLYLTHWIAELLAHAIAKKLGSLAFIEPALFLVLAVGGAYSSYRLLENPARIALRRWK